MLLKGRFIAYLGVLLGLNQVFIILSSVIETNTVILFAAAALIVGIVIVEFGGGKGFLFYLASCFLGFFLSFNKIELITYVLFFGLYSGIKHLIEVKTENKFLALLLKYIFFNISLAAMYLSVKAFVNIRLYWWMVIGGEVLFLIYDYAFTMFINYYIDRFKGKIIKK